MTASMTATAVRHAAPDADRDPFLGFVADEVTRAALARVAGQLGWRADGVLMGGIDEAVRSLGDIPTPESLVLDVSGEPEPLAALAAVAAVCDPGTRVIALGDVNDVNLYRDLVGLGVEDYLLKPVSPEALKEALTRAAAVPDDTARSEAEPGRLIAVVGARGGVGASTIALNTTWIMAHEMGRRVVLADLDLFFGDIALSLDLEPGRGFLEALQNPDRIDSLLLERALVRESDNLAILAAEEGLNQRIAFDPKALEMLLASLREAFDCVVLDLPRFGARTQLPLLKPPASLAVVTELTLAGMRDSMRLLEYAKEACPGADVRLVANQTVDKGKAGMSRADFEAGAERVIDGMIPADSKSAGEGAGTGRPLVQVGPRGKAGAALRDLAQDLCGADAGAVATPIWKRLMTGRA